jgi:vacuolar-type H+-ATPase subunit H
VSSRPDLLAPVREALLARARADAATSVEGAAAHAAEVLERARTEAAEILEQARRDGEREAAAVLAREAARSHREAREIVLASQRGAYQLLHQQVRAAVCSLRSEPGYPPLLERLRHQAQGELGPDAVIREHPEGGVVGEARERRLDLSLPTLADRLVAGLGSEVTRLWDPDA